MHWLKQLLFPIITISFMTLVILLGLELLLRLLPVNDPVPPARDMKIPTFPHYERNAEFVFSRGWDFEINNRGRMNNYGFVNDLDYDSRDGRPLLAVIGDSFIEAFMVPFENSVTGRLQVALGAGTRVYSFAMSGAPLSQYLLWAKNACEIFEPDALYMSVVGNDFDESHIEYKRARGGPLAPFTYFVRDLAGNLSYHTERFGSAPFHPTQLHAFASRLGLGRLALIRYIRSVYPGIDNAVVSIISFTSPAKRASADASANSRPEFFGNVEADVSDLRIADSRQAVTFFFDELAEIPCFEPSTTIFSVDGMRQSIYNPALADAAKSSYFGLMRDYFVTQARVRGYWVVDLHETFSADYKKHVESFEYRIDGHWNAHAHGVVANELLKREPVRSLIGYLEGG